MTIDKAVKKDFLALIYHTRDFTSDEIIRLMIYNMDVFYSEFYALMNCPQLFRDLFYILDYKAGSQIKGFRGYICDSWRSYRDNLKTALKNCGAVNEESLIEAAEKLDPDDKAYDRKFAALEKKSAVYKDSKSFWKLVKKYIDKMKSEIPYEDLNSDDEERV